MKVELRDLISDWMKDNILSEHFKISKSGFTDRVSLLCDCPMLSLHNFLVIYDNNVRVASAELEFTIPDYEIKAADPNFFTKLFFAMSQHCGALRYKIHDRTS